MPGDPQATPLLRFEDVSVRYGPEAPDLELALAHFDAELFAGDVLALVGESGSGKSTAGFAAAGLLPPNARVSGRIHFGSTALAAGSPNALAPFRGRKIGFVLSRAVHRAPPGDPDRATNRRGPASETTR